MATQVSLTGDIYPTKRIISLSPDRPSIDIGRASKSLNKGIVSAADNAWFDSPVMSRAHAKLALDLEDNRVTLLDIGSMHGTLVNNKPIKSNEDTTLKDNDIVVFGAQVTRGAETIPPCAFRVSYEYSPYIAKNGTMTFTFPDSSDIDEDYDVSENEAQDASSSGDGLSMGSPEAKTFTYMDAIDLTKDQKYQPSHIEASSQLQAMEGSEGLLSGDSVAEESHIDGIRMSSAIILDSDDENEDEYEPATPNIEHLSHDSMPEGHRSTQNVDSVLSFARDIIEPDGAQATDEIEEAINNYGSDSDLGLSDAEEEGLRAFHDLCGNKDNATWQEPTNDSGPSRNTYSFRYYEMAGIEAGNGTEPSVSPSRAHPSQNPAVQLASAIRQPSPSDAAMVKPPTTPISNSVPVHHLPSKEDDAPSVLLPMTNTAKLNKSQAIMTGAIMDASPQPSRSGLRIDDIIDNSASVEPETRKRKAEDISDVLVGEIQAWASLSALNSTKNAPPTAPESPPKATSAVEPSTASVPVLLEPENVADQNQPSSKRLKKVVEGAAYIALGGVGLFSLLVATAPDFL